MIRKILFASIWLAFILYAFIFAPGDRPEDLELIKNMSLGNWEGINPVILGEFNLMGIWPMIYGCLLFFDGKGQKIAAFPFAFASFLVGAFALLPYLALRENNPEFKGKKNWFLKLQDSKILAILITIGVLSCLGLAIFKGDWLDFIEQWKNSRFLNVMTLDFCLLSLLFPTLLKDDFKRRNINNNLLYWLIAFIPLLGPCFYLCFRSSLPDNN